MIAVSKNNLNETNESKYDLLKSYNAACNYLLMLLGSQQKRKFVILNYGSKRTCHCIQQAKISIEEYLEMENASPELILIFLLFAVI
jgi:hypothetical protein